MTRPHPILLGVLAGAATGLVVLAMVFILAGGDDEGPAAGPQVAVGNGLAAPASPEGGDPLAAGEGEVRPEPPPGADGESLAPDGPSSPGRDESPGQISADDGGDEGSPVYGPRIRTRPVVIYQRAAGDPPALIAVEAQIVWLPSPVDRAEEIVRMVLEGFPDEKGALRPGGVAVGFHHAYVDDRGVAWVDLQGESVARIQGSEEEQAVVACLARSLTESLDEVRAVGILVDGEPRRTLAGHLDLARTFTGSRWPVRGAGGTL